MTHAPQPRDDESQWQQPPFQPAEPSGAVPDEQPADQEVAGQVLVPRERRPPSVLESSLNVLNGVLWPVLLGLALFGVGNWVANVVIAIVASSLLGGISSELRRRRNYRPPTSEGYR